MTTEPKTVQTIVTYLEMKHPSHTHVHIPVNLSISLVRLQEPTLEYYRFLYNMIGKDHHWVDRLLMSDEELSALIHAPDCHIYVAYAGGCPAGYFEIDATHKTETWIAYFGVSKDYLGKGIGKWLISEAITTAWNTEPEVVKVHTCTLDHPRALPLYQKAGFQVYDRKEIEQQILE